MNVFCNIILIEVGIVTFCLIYDRWVDAVKVVWESFKNLKRR